MSMLKESVIEVPADLVRSFKGLSFDLGSTVFKCVYSSKENIEEVSSPATKSGHLHLLSFVRQELNDGFEYLRQRAYLLTAANCTNEMTTINATGIGCTQLGQTVMDALNVKLQIHTEFDCFAKSFVHLSSCMSRSQLLQPIDDQVAIEAIDYLKGVATIFANITKDGKSDAVNLFDDGLFDKLQHSLGIHPSTTIDDETLLSDAETNILPCLLAIGGSALAFVKIDKDGKASFVDYNVGGGKMTLGIAKLLVGCKTYSEFVDLASKGDASKVTQYTGQLLENSNPLDDDDSAYKEFKNGHSFPIFGFGWAADATNTGEFRREDIARAWLNFVAQYYAHSVRLTCCLHDIKKVFFCGGLTVHPFIRRVVATELAKRNLYQLMTAKSEPLMFDFVRHGHHLGVLGCVISDL